MIINGRVAMKAADKIVLSAFKIRKALKIDRVCSKYPREELTLKKALSKIKLRLIRQILAPLSNGICLPELNAACHSLINS